MTRTILRAVAIAALLSMASGGQAVAQDGDFQVWRKNLGTPSAKKGGAAPGNYQNTFSCIPSQCAKTPSRKAAKKRQPARKITGKHRRKGQKSNTLLLQPAIKGKGP